jgi:nitrate reductase molybdenum cofactor assembly chaperone NarJ/NarW
VIALDRIAPLFAYPGDGYAAGVAESARDADLPPLRAFASAVTALPTVQLQEQFVETFDLDPDCALDLGWHLFGERYERGEWLASLRGDLRRVGLEPSAELPDHLTNVLLLLAREDPARAADLAARVRPALDRLQAALMRRNSPYQHALSAARQVLDASRPAHEGADDV